MPATTCRAITLMKRPWVMVFQRVSGPVFTARLSAATRPETPFRRGAPPGPTYLISGDVDDGVNPIEGVLVSADNGGGSDTTNAAGHYELSVPAGTAGWTGTITPTKTGYTSIRSSLNIQPL